MNKYSIYILISMLFSMTSCLFENDMSYPDVPADIVTFDVEGQISADIDTESRTVKLILDELADMSHLKVNAVVVSPEASLAEPLPEYIDLTDTLRVIVRTFIDHEWIVTAEQPVARYITVENGREIGRGCTCRVRP
jgi:hypothetical protein